MKAAALQSLAWSVAGLALIGTLKLYQQPEFLVSLADQLWSCF